MLRLPRCVKVKVSNRTRLAVECPDVLIHVQERKSCELTYARNTCGECCRKHLGKSIVCGEILQCSMDPASESRDFMLQAPADSEGKAQEMYEVCFLTCVGYMVKLRQTAECSTVHAPRPHILGCFPPAWLKLVSRQLPPKWDVTRRRR